jgi:FtsP/CotA-like multicopper oxidase with cupredoxin domain/Cu/Ag efflux protein CusF
MPLLRLLIATGIGAALSLGSAAAALPECGSTVTANCREVYAGAASDAVVLGRDLDGDGVADEVTIRLEVDEIQEEVWPGKYMTFWVFAPPGDGMLSPARLPSPTIRVQQGDHVRIVLENTHYFPHTIHLHGVTPLPNAMDGVPDFTQAAVSPGRSFTYDFVAGHPGTFFYHCHVVPEVHVLMGLAGMLIIEPKRPHNYFRHLVIGAGRVRDLAKAEREAGYSREYSLVYQDFDDRLNKIPTLYKSPLAIERAMDRDYDNARRLPDVFTLDGRSFPYTLRDTPIEVASGDRVLLRVLNAGARMLDLHFHGHHVIETALDGYPVPQAARIVRDTVTVGPAQRADLELRAGNDGTYSSGPGVWMVHDHTTPAETNNGIDPGGDMNAIVYPGYTDKDGLPKVATSLKPFFDPDFYKGKMPMFDPAIWHDAHAADAKQPADPPYPVRDTAGDEKRNTTEAEEHRLIANSCRNPQGVLRVVIKEGAGAAHPGEVYSFEPRVIRVKRCERVELTLDNTDSVRHDLMIPGLGPMFTLDFTGPGIRTASFVTPDHDVTLPFHCHVPTHEEMGMRGLLVVGKGSPGTEAMIAALGGGTEKPAASGSPAVAPAAAKHLYEGVGIVKSVDARSGRVIIDHKAIQGFMAAMTMSYLVEPASLVAPLKPGDHVHFAIDADKREIVAIAPVAK